jgi:hypothetical protein
MASLRRPPGVSPQGLRGMQESLCNNGFPAGRPCTYNPLKWQLRQFPNRVYY